MSAFTLVGLLVAASAGAASVQTPDELAIRAMHGFGRCVVARSPRPTADLLRLDFRTAEYSERVERFARGHGYCTPPGHQLTFRGVLFAGALAEHLLESAYRPDQLPTVLARVPNPPLQARDEIEMMALCTVRAAPAEVAALLKQPVASKAELKAVKSLTPKLAACLAKDQPLKANRPGLRSVLALAAWRIASQGMS